LRFLAEAGGGCVDGAGSAVGAGVADSAASLAEERVTLRDMSNRTHQGMRM
jgi:hypothetical protein